MLKLLRLRLVVELRNPGRSDFDVGTVTVAALLETQASDFSPTLDEAVPAFAAKLLSEFEDVWLERFIRVGSRDGIGEVGERGTLRVAVVVVVVVVVVIVVSRGLGLGFDDVFRVVVP